MYLYLSCNGKNGNWGTGSDSTISIFVITNEKKGLIVQKNGKSYGPACSEFRQEVAMRSWFNSSPKLVEFSTLEECIKLIDKKYYSNLRKTLREAGIDVSKILNIEVSEDSVSEDSIKGILQKLKDNKAFNPDSAFKPPDLIEIYQELSDKNLIKTLNYEKFWLSEEKQLNLNIS